MRKFLTPKNYPNSACNDLRSIVFWDKISYIVCSVGKYNNYYTIGFVLYNDDHYVLWNYELEEQRNIVFDMILKELEEEQNDNSKQVGFLEEEQNDNR